MTVSISVDGTTVATDLPDAGSYSHQFTAGQEGEHTAVVTSEQDPTQTGSVTFTVPFGQEAAVSVDKTEVDSGGTVADRTIAVSGTMFPPDTAGTVTLNSGAPGSGGTEIASDDVTTDASGAFTASLVVPEGQSVGDYHVVATVGATVVDDTAITVTAAASIAVDKNEVDSGGDAAERTIAVQGANFSASATGTVTLNTGAPGSGGTVVDTADVTAGAGGGFSASLVVPEGQAAGEYHVVADVGSDVVDDTAITVVDTSSATIMADKTEVAADGDAAERTVTVDGVGFAPDSAGVVELQEGPPGTPGTVVDSFEVTVDGDGNFVDAALVVPSGQAAGDYHVTASIGAATPDDLPLTVFDTALAAPANLTLSDLDSADDGTTASVATSWDATAGADQYLVEYKTAAQTWDEAQTQTVAAAAVDLIDLPSDQWQVRVVAQDTTGAAADSDPSAIVDFSTVQLAAPANLTASGITDTSVDLAWDAVTGAAEYGVEYSSDGGTSWTIVALDDPTATTATADGLTADTAYTFRVQGDGDGASQPTNGAFATVDASTLPQLASPANLAVAGTPTATSIALDWDATAGADQYVARWAPTPVADNWTELAPTAATDADVTGLTADTEYAFAVKAQDTTGAAAESDWSAQITATTAAA